MKSFIAALILSAILISGGIYSSVRIGSLSEDLTAKNEKLLDSLNEENYSSAAGLLSDIDSIVEKNSIILASFMDHNELDKIKTNLVQLEVYISENQKAPALSSASVLQLLFEHLPADYQIKAENIF